ncbi:MAG: hypothetical protein HZB43_09575 [candidate division Zixibacteria bacterium]|nr:hypothetical protein [candidate division Zixibacteria bacterium]
MNGKRLAIMRRLTLSILLCLSACVSATAQDSIGVFHTDPAGFFAGNPTRIWIGHGRFMMTNFSDTVAITADSGGRVLSVRRVLINEDDTVVVSRGHGSISITPGESTLPFHWTEARYPEVTGRMKFDAGQWALEFNGEWKQWAIRIARLGDNAFNAQIGRALGSLPPVMFSALTYQAQPPKPKAKAK